MLRFAPVGPKHQGSAHSSWSGVGGARLGPLILSRPMGSWPAQHTMTPQVADRRMAVLFDLAAVVVQLPLSWTKQKR